MTWAAFPGGRVDGGDEATWVRGHENAVSIHENLCLSLIRHF